MKKRFKKTKRETLKGLIIKTVVIASVICIALAYIRWDVMIRNINDQFKGVTNRDFAEIANRIDSTSESDPLPEFINKMTENAYTAVTVYDFSTPSFDEVLSDILGYSYIDHSYVVGVDYIGSIYGTPGCYSVAVITDKKGNIVGENTERVLLNIHFSDEDYSELFSFAEETSDDPEVVSLFREIKNHDSEYLRVDMEMDSVYINRKTHKFIPCKGRIKNENDRYLTDNDQVNSREFSISVDDNGYELIEFNRENGSSPEVANLIFNGEKQEDIDRILECFKLSPFGGGISDIDKFKSIMNESDSYNERNYQIYLNGEPYYVYTINFLKYKTPEVMKLYHKNVICLSVLVFIIAALLCIVKYSLTRTKYVMEDYERDLTNHLAHDLKTPLMAIGGYAENILDGKLTEDEKKEYLEAIIENVEFADSTMSRTLMLNSMDGNAGFKYETTDVGKVVSEAVKKYEPLLEQNNISFSLEGSATVKAESTSFEKIVENLISNAVKYTSESGSIKVMIDKNKMVISNTVNGKIDTRKLKEPFVRGEESRSNLGGSGLGLSIAERAAALNGFRLNISCTDNEFKAEVKF